MTALHGAANFGHHAIVRLLLEAGSEVDLKDDVSVQIFLLFHHSLTHQQH